MPLTQTTATPSSVAITPAAGGGETYRAVFNHTAVAGQAVEIAGSGSKTIRITKLAFLQPGAALVLTVRVQSAASTGGTSSNPTRVPLNSSNAAATATVKTYTAAPTPGALVGNIFVDAVGTADRIFLEFGSSKAQELVLQGTAETAVLAIDTGAAVIGYVEWIEE